MRTTEYTIRICYVVDEPKQWERFLPYVTLAYNTALQSTFK